MCFRGNGLNSSNKFELAIGILINSPATRKNGMPWQLAAIGKLSSSLEMTLEE